MDILGGLIGLLLSGVTFVGGVILWYCMSALAGKWYRNIHPSRMSLILAGLTLYVPGLFCLSHFFPEQMAFIWSGLPDDVSLPIVDQIIFNAWAVGVPVLLLLAVIVSPKEAMAMKNDSSTANNSDPLRETAEESLKGGMDGLTRGKKKGASDDNDGVGGLDVSNLL